MDVMQVTVNIAYAGGMFIIIGVTLFIFGLICLWFPQLGIPIIIIGVLLASIGGPIGLSHDRVNNDNNFAAAIQKLEPYRVQLAETKFYLKEMEQKDLLHGELKGNFGTFLAIGGGSIYGRIDQEEKLTVVYLDNDAVIDRKVGVHNVSSFLLTEIDIYTIGAGEKPYFKFTPKIVVERNRVRLVVKNPEFYLPEGWDIIEVSKRY